MKPLPDAARTKNISGKEFCRYCLNDGYVVVALRPPARVVGGPVSVEGVLEEMGPCPFCEHGVRIEFQGGAPWGTGGYWQGRTELADVVPLSSSQGWKVPPPSISRGMLDELGRTIGVRVDDAAFGAAAAATSTSPAKDTETSSGPGSDTSEPAPPSGPRF